METWLTKYLRNKAVLTRLIALFGALFSMPASAQSGFTFIEFNAAFALGLSLPLIIMSVIIREKITNSWWYLILLTSALLTFLHSLTETSSATLSSASYSAAAIFTLFLTLLPRTGVFTDENKITPLTWVNYTALIVALVFVVLFSFTTLLPLTVAWAIYASLMLVFTGYRFTQLKQQSRKENLRYGFLWLLMAYYCGLFFLPADAILSQQLLVVSAIACMLIASINYAWLLSSKIKQQVENELSPQINELRNLTLDAITKLPSQSQVVKNFQNEISQHNTFQYALVAFKPINFAKMNHLLGHQNSDLLLIQLAYSIQQQVENNLQLVNFEPDGAAVRVARLPSLQFLVILNLTNCEHQPEEHVEELCRNLLQAVPQAINFKSVSLNFELAFGIDFFTEKSRSISESLAWASDALLTAEESGTSICFFNHQNEQYTEDALLKMEQLKQAVSADKLQWLCLPQIHSVTKQVTGLTLDILWQQHKEHNQRLEEFLTIAESSGEIYNITKQAINKACELAMTLTEEKKRFPITIKFASSAVLDEVLIEHIEQQLKTHKLEHDAIMVEISEQVMNSEKQKAKRFIDRLKLARINIAINNFSASYEALKYLRKISVSQIKIDCNALSVSKNIQTEKAIVNALLNVAQMMHIPIIGYNVNQATTLESFESIGGEFIQGKVIAPDVTIEQFNAWLTAWKSQHPGVI